MGRQRHHVRYLCFIIVRHGLGIWSICICLSAFFICLTFVISDQEAVRLYVWFEASIYSDGDMNASGRSV